MNALQNLIGELRWTSEGGFIISDFQAFTFEHETICLDRLLGHHNFLLLNFSILKNGHLFSTRKTLEDSFFVLQSYTVFGRFMQIALQLEIYNEALH
jgi:hypothetical protein